MLPAFFEVLYNLCEIRFVRPLIQGVMCFGKRPVVSEYHGILHIGKVSVDVFQPTSSLTYLDFNMLANK